MNGLNEFIKYISFVFELYSSDYMQSCEGVICGFPNDTNSSDFSCCMCVCASTLSCVLIRCFQ